MSNQRLEKLLEMLEKQPDDLFLQYAMGMEYLGLNDMLRAENAMRNVIRADEHYVAAYYQLGKILIGKQAEQEAVSVLEMGLKEAKLKGDNKTTNEFRSLLDEILF